jgi:hypothetical protein
VNFNIEIVVYMFWTLLEKTRMEVSSRQGVSASITVIDALFLALFTFRDLRNPV